MLKYFFLFTGFWTGSMVYGYLFNDHFPGKFSVALWGIFTAVMMFLEFFKLLVVEKTQQEVEQFFQDEIEPIKKNVNLTDEEKQERIGELVAARLNKKLNQLQGEKNG